MSITYEEVIERLHDQCNPNLLEKRSKRFGIKPTNALGLTQEQLNEIAKQIRFDNKLAMDLFQSGIYEGKLLCAKTFNPKDVTESLMDYFVESFDTWEICDTFSMKLFARSKFALMKIVDWADCEPEFQKRAAFATMAAYCMYDKKSENNLFEQFFEIILLASRDNRLYVKKAVNWALRNIGKRNVDLKHKAIHFAIQLEQHESLSAKWIARNALEELRKDKLRISDYPRSIYRR